MSRKVTFEDFYERAKAVHGEAYNYSKDSYVGARGSVEVTCQKHGSFTQLVGNHLAGRGCAKCALEKKADSQKVPFEAFVSRASVVHSSKYIYMPESYSGTNKYVRIVCPQHGGFTQVGNAHLKGQGCPKCARDASKITLQEFLVRAKDIHGERYSYGNLWPGDMTRAICITCKLHGVFMQSPHKHLAGQGCPTCGQMTSADKRTTSFTQMLEASKLVHGEKYSYDETSYISLQIPFNVTCPVHGVFSVTGDSLLNQKSGCPLCAKISSGLLNTHSFEDTLERIKAVHGNTYTYYEEGYTGASGKILAECKEHGKFYQLISSHLNGSRCPTCASRVSLGQVAVTEFVSTLVENVLTNHIYDKQTSKREVDIYIPSHNLAIEFNGAWWHSSKFKDKNYHNNKQQELAKLGIRCIQIFDDEWQDRTNQVKALISNALGKSTLTTHARKTTLTEIPHYEAKDFHNLYHIQGTHPGGLSYALEYQDEKVAVMSFRQNQDYTWELVRFSSNGRVPGAASKLFKHFLKTENPKEVLSFSDNRLFTGKMYEALNFKHEGETPVSYTYVTQASSSRMHKFNFRHARLATRFPATYNPDLTEKQNCELAGHYQVWDCGLTRWKYTNRN